MADDVGGSYFGPRWSYHLARPPGWLEGAPSAAVGWVKNRVYDRSDVDPNAELARIESAVRAEGARLGVRIPEDSGGALRLAAMLEVGATTWQQIASTGSSVTPSGAGALSAPLLDVVDAATQERIRTFREAVSLSGGEPDATDANVLALLGPISSPVQYRSVNPDPVIVSTPVGLGDRVAPIGGAQPLGSPSFMDPPPLMYAGGSGGGMSTHTLLLLALAGGALWYASQK
jgi:hypothetical protein